MAQSGQVLRLHTAVGGAFAVGDHIAVHGGDEGPHYVVDVNEGQGKGRVPHFQRQAVGGVVAEGGHHAVVVGAAPLAEHTRQPEHIHRRAGFFAVGVHRRLRHGFALAVVVVQSRLGAAGHQHRGGRFCFCQQVQQHVGEAGVAGIELAGVLGAVNARKMEHKAGPGGILRQGLGGVVLFKQHQVAKALRPQGGHQVFADESARAGDEDGGVFLHGVAVL